jgi:hypothetical protein
MALRLQSSLLQLGHGGAGVVVRDGVAVSAKTETYEPGDAIFIPDGEEHKHRPRVLTDKVTFFSVEKT